MMRTIQLHGDLGELFGESHKMDCDSMRDVIMALGVNFPGFFQKIRSNYYQVVRGTETIGPNKFGMSLGGCTTVHIIPTIVGGDSSGKGVFQVILGAVMIATAIAAPYMAPAEGIFLGGGAGITLEIGSFSMGMGQLALTGALMTLAGIYSLVASPPTVGSNDDKNDVSYLINGPLNRSDQGATLGVAVGMFNVSGTQVSAGIGISSKEAVDDDALRTIPVTVTFSPVECGSSYTPTGDVYTLLSYSMTVTWAFIWGWELDYLTVNGTTTIPDTVDGTSTNRVTFYVPEDWESVEVVIYGKLIEVAP